MTQVRYRVVAEGRVQGVFFRETARRVAADLGVSGWVRNLADGSVEAVFEGPELPVARAIEWTRSGPPHAVVTSFQHTAEEPEGLDSFEIRG
jgi:acylphosphatase